MLLFAKSTKTTQIKLFFAWFWHESCIAAFVPGKEKCVQSHVGRIRLVFFKFSLKEEELFQVSVIVSVQAMRVTCCSLHEHWIRISFWWSQIGGIIFILDEVWVKEFFLRNVNFSCCWIDEHLDQNRILVEPYLRRSLYPFW